MSWSVNGPAAPPARSPHHHTLGKFLKKLKKQKHDGNGMFVPPDVQPNQQRYDTYSGRPSPRPALPVPPNTIRSISHENTRRSNVNLATDHTMYLSPGAMGTRRISAPQLHEGNGDTRWGGSAASVRAGGNLPTPSPPSVSGTPTASVYGTLSIDTGHGETAGSGMGYITQGASLSRAQHEDPAERLAAIRSVYDEKNRILNVVTEDIMKLQSFIAQYESEKMVKFTRFLEYLNEKGQEELKEDIELAKSELERLRRECPDVVPPPVPVRPSVENRPRWNCLQCTSCNDKDSYRCKECTLPCTRFDPAEKRLCKCEHCQTTVQLQLSPLQDDWMLVSQVNRL